MGAQKDRVCMSIRGNRLAQASPTQNQTAWVIGKIANVGLIVHHLPAVLSCHSLASSWATVDGLSSN